jgi:cell wall-associated NlpC family hydrolase
MMVMFSEESVGQPLFRNCRREANRKSSARVSPRHQHALDGNENRPQYSIMWIKTTLIAVMLSLNVGHCRADDDGEPALAALTENPTPSAWSDRAQELVFHALAFIDVKYKYGGLSPDTGWDCSGYVYHVFKEAVGVILPRNAASMSAEGRPVRRGELQPGDLVFFNTLKRAFSHVGIYLGDNRFIHAPSAGKAVQISSMASDYWARRYNGGRRIVLAQGQSN